MNDRARERGRAAIYSMAGIYLLYLAYSMYKELTLNPGEGGGVFIMVSMAAFVILGIGLMGFALKMMKDSHKRDQLEQDPGKDVAEETSGTDE